MNCKSFLKETEIEPSGRIIHARFVVYRSEPRRTEGNGFLNSIGRQ
jgi:hypothetical protein